MRWGHHQRRRPRHSQGPADGVPHVRLGRLRFPRLHAHRRFRNAGGNLRTYNSLRRPTVRRSPRGRLDSARNRRAGTRYRPRNSSGGAGDYRPLPVARILPGKTAQGRSGQVMRIFMRSVVSKPGAVLLDMTAAYLCASCARREPVQAGSTKGADVPTVAVAKVTTEDLSHGLVLTAEFKPYQEVDVMAKVAGFVKKINVDVGDRVNEGQLLATLEIPEMDDDLRRADAAVVRAKAEVTRAKDEQPRAESTYDNAQ